MQLTPDNIIYFSWGAWQLNATLVNTWIVMAVLVGGSYLITRKLDVNQPPKLWQNIVELVVITVQQQVQEISSQALRPIMYFAGSLFLFIAASNLLTLIPGFRAPTGSLSTTLALTLVVLCAVPLFSIQQQGLGYYLRQFVQPVWILLPFNLLSEASKTLSLSMRLYGNVMSGAVIGAILLTLAPFFFPIIMELLGLLTGMIQAYIFAVLATVYIAAALADPPASKSQHNQVKV